MCNKSIILGLIDALMTLFAAVGCLFASKKIFKSLLPRVLRNPMSFFDTTPYGRILNIIGKDIDTVDNVLPFPLLETVITSFEVYTFIMISLVETRQVILT